MSVKTQPKPLMIVRKDKPTPKRGGTPPWITVEMIEDDNTSANFELRRIRLGREIKRPVLGITLLHELAHLRHGHTGPVGLDALWGITTIRDILQEAEAWRWVTQWKQRRGKPLNKGERKYIRRSYRTYLRDYKR